MPIAPFLKIIFYSVMMEIKTKQKSKNVAQELSSKFQRSWLNSSNFF